MIKFLRKLLKKEKPITQAFKNLGQLIKQSCEEQDISSQQLAEHIGVETTLIEEFFEGHRIATYEYLHSICELLSLDMCELLEKSKEDT